MSRRLLVRRALSTSTASARHGWLEAQQERLERRRLELGVRSALSQLRAADPEKAKSLYYDRIPVSVESRPPEESQVQVDPRTGGILRTEASLFGAKAIRPLDEHYAAWFHHLSKEIVGEQRKVQAGVPGKARNVYGPYLRLLPADVLAAITVQEAVHLAQVHPDGVLFSVAALNVGRACFDELENIKAATTVDVWNDLQQGLKIGMVPEKQDMYRDIAFRQVVWNRELQLQVGACLLSLLMRSAFLMPEHHTQKGSKLNDNGREQTLEEDDADKKELEDVIAPAFYHSRAFSNEKKYGVFLPHTAVVTKLLNTTSPGGFAFLNRPNFRPMVCPPKPWTSAFVGGFLTQQAPVIRVPFGAESQYNILRDQHMAESAQKTFDALNVLAEVPWTLNKRVHEAAKFVQNYDIEFTGRPSIHNLELQQVDKILSHKSPSKDRFVVDGRLNRAHFDEARRSFKASKQRASRKRQELMSRKLDFDSRVDFADFCDQHEQFWFPYSVDFRGRAYPIPPISHIADDLARGLICFSESQPLGPDGLRWLKIHLANQFGQDKLSFDERVKWTDDHLEVICDCAKRPFNDDVHKSKLWGAAENPWQALATCIEISDALDSGDPESFMSGLPVHQDGSCNGLQHYAALGRDQAGGAAVNLVAAERPGDVYTQVLNFMVDVIEDEVEKGRSAKNGQLTAPEIEMREKLLKMTTRKVVKQTVMTSVYGVTSVGARAQIMRQLEDISDRNKELRLRGEPHGPVLEDEDEIFRASLYLATTTLSAIGSTFQSADKVKKWFQVLARMASSMEDSVSWVTPLGLPVVQPYYVKEMKRVTTLLQQVVLYDLSEGERIDKRKQVTAFPPNFVHSIDSSHMLLTALECKKHNMTFASVHDSFWTHAGRMTDLSRILRETFIDLHQQEILWDLHAQFQARYPQLEIPAPPIFKGEDENFLDIKEVANSKYFFS